MENTDSTKVDEGTQQVVDVTELGANSGKSAPIFRGLGLPCSDCGAYYPANLSECPICRCTERTSPAAVPLLPGGRAGLAWSRTDASGTA